MRDGGDILSAIQELLHHQENMITIKKRQNIYIYLFSVLFINSELDLEQSHSNQS